MIRLRGGGSTLEDGELLGEVRELGELVRVEGLEVGHRIRRNRIEYGVIMSVGGLK